MANASALWLPVLPSMKDFGPSLIKGVAKDAEKAGKTSGKKFGLALGAAAATFAGIAAAGTAFYNVGKTFDEMSDIIAVSSGATGAELEGLVDSAKNVGTQVPGEFSVIGDSLATLNTLTGATGEHLEGMTGKIMEASRMLGEDASSNADKFGSVMQQWQIPAEEGEAKLDALFTSTQKYGMSLEGVMGHLNTYGPVLQNAGFTMEESATLFGQLEAGGISVSRVMPGLNASFRRWAQEGKNSQEELQNNVAAIRDTEDAQEALSIATDTFGAEGAQRLTTAIRNGTLELDDLTGALANSEGAIDSASEETMSFSEHWELFKNNILVALAPLAEQVFGGMSDMMERMVPVLTDRIIPAFENFVGWLERSSTWLVPLVATVAGFAAAVIGVNTAVGIWNTLTRTWTTVTTVATAIQKGFNAALKANPIGLVITAITLLVGALIWFFTETETGQKIWEKFTQFLGDAWDWIVDKWNETIDWIVQKWNEYGQPLVDGVAEGFRWLSEDVVQPALKWIEDKWTAAVDWIVDKWNRYGQPLVDGVADAFVWLYEIKIKPALQWVEDKWSDLMTNLGNIWDRYGQPVIDIISDVIEGDFTGAFQKAKDLIEDIWTGVANIVRKPINWVINTVYNDGIRGVVNGIGDFIGIDEVLPSIDPLPRFAKGGYHKGGWAIVGEEGPELVNFDQPGRVYTADETQEMLAGERQAPMGALDMLHGDSPEDAHVPAGGWWDSITSGARAVWDNTIGAALDWARGKLAETAKIVTEPLKGVIRDWSSGSGLTELLGDVAIDVIDKVVGWATGHDDEAKAEDAAGGTGHYDGPLGRFVHPMPGPITSRYGPRWGGIHSGIDFARPIGTAVRAAFDGVIVRNAWNAVAGRTGMGTLMAHGGGRNTYYGHLSRWARSPGEEVKAGDTIAYSGNTGNSTGPHLHFEKWRGGSPINPGFLFRDDGGELPRGLSMVLNDRPESEWILNQPQVDQIEENYLARGAGGNTFHIDARGQGQLSANDLVHRIDFETTRRAKGGVYA